MRLRPFVLVVVLILIAVPSRGARAQRQATLSDLSWFAGSWVTTDGATRIEEYWTRPSDNSMLGMGRTIKDGRTMFFEYLRIESRDDGIYYVAHPAARPGTDFKLTSFDAGQATFENPTHDFPKRIRYRRESDGSITAITDAGSGESKEPPQEFRYRKLPD